MFNGCHFGSFLELLSKEVCDHEQKEKKQTMTYIIIFLASSGICYIESIV